MASSPLAGALAKTVHKAFKGLFLDATLTRDGANSGEGYSPNLAEATVYTCKAIAQEYSAGTSGTDLVGATDMNVLILADSLSVTPEPLDRVAIPSQGFSGVIYGGAKGMKAVRTDPAKATWQCRVVT